jgi:hypothetical protein
MCRLTAEGDVLSRSAARRIEPALATSSKQRAAEEISGMGLTDAQQADGRGLDTVLILRTRPPIN